MANHMKDVANMLGVELGERFNIVGIDNKCHYYLTENGLFCEEMKSSNFYTTKDNNLFFSVILTHLLDGVYTIKHIPWKPNFNERYYSIGPGGVLEPGNWSNDFIDRALYKLGNCYRTAQEAETNRDKWVAFYESDKQLEV